MRGERRLGVCGGAWGGPGKVEDVKGVGGWWRQALRRGGGKSWVPGWVPGWVVLRGWRGGREQFTFMRRYSVWLLSGLEFSKLPIVKIICTFAVNLARQSNHTNPYKI